LIGKEFCQTGIQKPKSDKELAGVVGSLIDELNRTHEKLQDTFGRVQSSMTASGDTNVIIATNVTTGSSVVATDMRANQVAVVAGSNVINFATPMTSDYVIIPIYITSRAIEFIDPTQIVYTMTGFTVIVPSAGFLTYLIAPKT